MEEIIEGVVYRKYDSEDVMRLRSKTVITTLIEKDNSTKIDTGLLQKNSIILGIQKCPWFTDVVDEDKGVTDEIYNKRNQTEFRKIPPQHLDVLFKQSSEFNKADFSVDDLKKK